jgi:hypothetical protein
VLTLTATLQAAQQKFDVDPRISALVSDNPPEAPRLSELASQYTGTEPDDPFDAAFVFGGYIARCYLDGPAATATVFAQVVALPASPANWSTWTTLANPTSNVAGTAQVCLRGDQASSLVYVFWVDPNGHTIHESHWTPAGGWTAAATVADPGAGFSVSSLASDGADPTIRLFYAVAAGQLYETHWTGAAWSAPGGDGGNWGGPTIGAGYRTATAPNGDGNAFILIASGTTTSLTVKFFGITSNPGWGASNVLQTAGTSSGYSYAFPKLMETRSDSLRQCLTWSETAPAPIGTLAQIAFTPTHNAICGVVPWRYAATHGVRVFRDTFASPAWWICTSNQVYSCPADTASVATGQRVSFPQSQIVSFRLDQHQANYPARAQLVVTNEKGALFDGGLAGPHRALRQWSQVAVKLGYHTTLPGDETLWQVPLWISSIVYHDEVQAAVPLVTLNMVDAWGILELLRFRDAVTYTNLNVAQILDKLIYYVCGTLNPVDSNARLAGVTLATFTVRAGETIGSVARRLLDLCAVSLVFRTNSTSVDGTGLDSVGVVPVNRASAGPVYTYGPATGQHPIVQSEVEPYATPTATAVEVAGLSTWSLTRNWTPAWLLWRDTRAVLSDKTLGTQAYTDSVAGYLASLYQPQANGGGKILTLANVAQEVADQINLNIPTSPVTSIGTAYSIVGRILSWQQKVGLILQTLTLEGTN